MFIAAMVSWVPVWFVVCAVSFNVGVDSSTSARVPVSVSVAGKCVIGFAYLPSPYAVCVPLSLQPGLRLRLLFLHYWDEQVISSLLLGEGLPGRLRVSRNPEYESSYHRGPLIR